VVRVSMCRDEGGKQDARNKPDEAGPLLKVVWSAAEALGNIAATVKGGNKDSTGVTEQVHAAMTQDEALERLTKEYANEYFLSGEVDLSLYEDDCVFADPFASFRGKERFKNNLSNLGLFITQSQARLLSLTVTQEEPLIIKSRVMVKLQLNLPWEPVLAWPWSVEHVFSERGLISEHIEGWEVSAGEGVKQVFRPAPKAGWPN